MLNINTAGLTLPANATFEMSATSTFTITNGSIVFQNANANTGGDLLINAGGSKSVTGGTTQFGNNLTPVSQAFKVNSQVALHNILVNGINNPTAQLLAALTISNDVTVNAGGTINANNQNITGLSTVIEIRKESADANILPEARLPSASLDETTYDSLADCLDARLEYGF